MAAKASFERSMILPPVNGPRSLMVTVTDLPVETFVT
jgi:hypothetical protein